MRFARFALPLQAKQTYEQMKNVRIVLALVLAAVLLGACGKKKQSDDIIAPKVVEETPKEPVRSQEYNDDRQVEWLGKDYHVSIHRHASDSLPMVQDENGQKFVDNVFMLVVQRSDGSVFFQQKFTKSQLVQYLDDQYKEQGIFEGLVFDQVDGDYLRFGASVGIPQSDEYIPLVFRLSKTGALQIPRDRQMDTTPEQGPSSEDI